MFIEIQELEKEPRHVHHEYGVGEIEFQHEDAVLADPVTADFTLSHQDSDLRITGKVVTAIRFKCSRCAREFLRPFSASFELNYLPQPDWSKRDDEIELKYEEMDVGYYDGVRFDVDLMVLEQIELGMPMKFVCREDCKGLCYLCGADLNDGPCPCKRERTDTRLSGLLEFRRKKPEKQ